MRRSPARPARSARQLLSQLARRTFGESQRVWHRNVLGRRFIEKRIYDYRLLLDSEDPGISSCLLRHGERESEQKFILERELRPGMNALDLGANLGYYTIMMSRRVGERGHVYAVEPFPGSFALLRENISRNGVQNVDVDNVAIAERDGERPLLLTTHSNWHSFHVPRVSPAMQHHARYARAITGSVRVRTRSLADFLSEKKRIDLLRRDIEGYEVHILRLVSGLPHWYTRRLHILFETHPEFYDPHRNDMRGVLDALCRRHGLRIKYLVSDFHFGSRAVPEIEPGRLVFEGRGYGAEQIVRQFRNRAIYADIRTADAIDLICNSEYVHAALLAPGLQ